MGLANGSYVVTPSEAGDTFSPASKNVTVASANLTNLNFTVAPSSTWTISGTISPAGIGSGATITVGGAATATTSADGSGNYSFGGLPNGTYSVTPSESGYVFTPSNQTVLINNVSATSVNFTGTQTGGAGAIAVDAQVSADRSSAHSRIASPAFSTGAGNELLLALISTDYLSGSNTTVSSVAGAGLTWVLVARTNAQNGTAEIWRAFASAPLSGATVTATLSQRVAASMTIVSFTGVDSSGTNGSGAIGATASGNAGYGAPTASLVTTRDNSLVVAVGNDFDQAIERTPGANQSVLHQYLASVGDTYWAQIQNSSTPLSGTTVTMNDTSPTSDRYNLTICEILAPY